MDADKKMLKKLYGAIIDYFHYENEFRGNPSKKTWDKRVDADRVLTVTVAEARSYLRDK